MIEQILDGVSEGYPAGFARIRVPEAQQSAARELRFLEVGARANRAAPSEDHAKARKASEPEDENPGLPNWLDISDPRQGTLFWRFLLPAKEPEKPYCRLLPLTELSALRC